MSWQALFGHDEEVAAYVAAGLGVSLYPPYPSIGFLDDAGRLVGGAVYTDYTGTSIEVTLYAPGTITRGKLRLIFAYPFVQLGVLGLIAKTRRGNKPMCDMLPRVGFTFKCALERHFGPLKSDDAILFRLDHSAASRWL